MEELHGGPTSVYEVEDIAQTDVISHPVVNHPHRELILLRMSVFPGHRKMLVLGFHGCQGES